MVAIQPSTTKSSDKKPVGFRIRLAYCDGDVPTFDPFDEQNATKLPLPSYTEDFDDLVVDESSPDYYGKRFPFIDLGKKDLIQGPESSALGILVRKSDAAGGVIPDTKAGTALTGGTDVALTAADYEDCRLPLARSTRALRRWTLDPYRDVALVYAPGLTITGTRQRSSTSSITARACASASPSIDCEKGQANSADLEPRNDIDSSVRRVLLPVDRHLRSADRRAQSSCRRAVTCSASTRAPTPSAACSRRRPTRSCAACSISNTTSTTSTQDVAESAGRQRHPPVSRARHPRLGRAHADLERAVEVRQRAAAVHLPRALDLRGHAVGRLRAERRRAVGARDRHDPPVPARAVAPRRAVRAAPRKRRSSSPATARR